MKTYTLGVCDTARLSGVRANHHALIVGPET